jgi:hypothetical protein
MDGGGSVGPIGGGGQPNMNFMQSFHQQFMTPNDGGNIGAHEWELKEQVN